MTGISKSLAWVMVVLWLLTVPAAAAETGSLEVVGISEGIQLYSVLDSDARPAPKFAEAGELLAMTDSAPAEAARLLAEYALDHDCPSVEAKPDRSGSVFYQDLSEGVYLVSSDGKEFAPFLVKIPTELDGKTVYHLEAKPKIDDDPEETEPATETVPAAESVPTDTAIPQTGINRIPKYLLMGLGTGLTLLGLYEMLRGREDAL